MQNSTFVIEKLVVASSFFPAASTITNVADNCALKVHNFQREY